MIKAATEKKFWLRLPPLAIFAFDFFSSFLPLLLLLCTTQFTSYHMVYIASKANCFVSTLNVSRMYVCMFCLSNCSVCKQREKSVSVSFAFFARIFVISSLYIQENIVCVWRCCFFYFMLLYPSSLFFIIRISN